MEQSPSRLRAVLLAGALLLAVGSCASSDERGDGARGFAESGFAAPACTDDPRPPGGRACPKSCTGGCDESGLCTIACHGSKSCEEMGIITCPEGYACRVECLGLDACDSNTINCPEGFACTLACDGKDGCGDVILECGSASCSIECGAHPAACEGALVACGRGSCRASCQGDSTPHLGDCESACACSQC